MAIPLKLAYTEQGKGLPVVLLHGYPLSSAIWREQVKGLADHYRVITPDLRGHGTSPAPEGVYDMDTMANDVFALLDGLGVQKFVLIGHSMGGYVSLAAWKMHPDRVLALGLIDSQAGADTEEARQGRFAMADKVAEHGASVVAEAMVPKLFAPGLAADDFIVEQVRTIIVSTNPTGIIGTLKGMAARPDSSAILPNLDIPVLLLTGDKDALIPPSKSDSMASAISGATQVVVENAGHMPMMEQPTATTEAIRQFLSEVQP